MCVVSQDGWSNVHNEPIIATTIHCEGTLYPLASTYTGTEKKTADYCVNLLKTTITSAENNYCATVVGFVSDSEPKMKALRKVRKYFHMENLIVWSNLIFLKYEYIASYIICNMLQLLKRNVNFTYCKYIIK